MDSNHTYDPKYPDLPGAVYPQRDDEWAEEYTFFSADATHGLKDAWLEHLQTRPDELECSCRSNWVCSGCGVRSERPRSGPQ